MAANNHNGSFFESLARRCARHPWAAIFAWVMLLAMGGALFMTVFSKNMTTVTKFTTNAESKMADELFIERFPQAAYKVENAVITSDTYTADDAEFWAYVDGLYAKLQPLMDSGVVKGVQYYDAALRGGLPLVPPVLQQMVDAIELALNDNATSAQLAQAAAQLQASAASLGEAADGLADNLTALTAAGVDAVNGMVQAVDGARELAGTLLLKDALTKLHNALGPIAAGQSVTEDVLRATVADLQATAPPLRVAADDLEATGPGTSARPQLIAGLRDTANGLEEIAGLYWLREGIARTNSALRPIAENQPVPTETCRTTATMLRNTAPELRAAAAALEAAGPGTVDQRPTLIAGLRDTANGLEEVAGLYWLRDGITKTNNALRPIAENQAITTDTCRATATMLRNSAPDLRAAAAALEATGPGTVDQRPTLVAGLRDTANGLEEVAGLYWLREGLGKTRDALKPIVDGVELSPETRQATADLLQATAPELRAAADLLVATGPGTVDQRPTLIDGLRQSADGLEEVAGLYDGLYYLRKGLGQTHDALQTIVDNVTVTTDQCRTTATMLMGTAADLRAAADDLAATGPATASRDTLVSGLRQAANGLEEVAGLYWLRDGLTKSYDALVPMAAGDPLTDEIRDNMTTMLWNSPAEMRAMADALVSTGTGTSDVYAVGKDGSICHYDGVAWSSVSGVTASSVNGVWGASSDNVFVVGDGGTVVHFDGSAWTTMASGSTADLHGVWGSSSDDVFAVADNGTILHFDGSAWTTMASGTTAHLYSIWGSASNDVFAVGAGGAIRHYNGSAWSALASGIGTDLYSVRGTSASDVFAVGAGGIIRHYNGSAWSGMTSGTAESLYGVWAASSSDVCAVGAGGTIRHYNGSAWSGMASGTTENLYEIWGNGSFDIYAVGNAGAIVHDNGTAWSSMASGTSSALWGIWGRCDRADLVAGIRDSASGLEELAGVYELKNCAQKGLEFANLLVPDPYPSQSDVNAGIDEMYVTEARLMDAIDRLEATAPGTSARQQLLDGLNQAVSELEAYMPQAELLRIPLALWFAIYTQQGTIQDQRDTAQAGLDQVQSQCAANIGQVSAGLVQIQTQCTDNMGQVEDGLTELATQYGQVEAGLAQVQTQCNDNLGVTAAGLVQLQTQCNDNLSVTADGLAQLQTQCSDQIGTVAAGLANMRKQLSDQLPTAAEGAVAAANGAAQAAGLVSTDRRTALFAISMSEDADEAASHILELRKYVLTGNGIGVGEDTFENGFRVRMVGSSNVSRDMQDVALRDLMKSMMVAIPVALIVLLVVFGTLGAAMLPIVLGLVSIVVALGIAAVVGIWMPLNFAIENIVAMLGLALGIDHALFVAYRYREERQRGRDKIEAIAKSGATAGRAIFYAGLIVVVALIGIFMMPCNMHKSLAMGAIIVVCVIAPASITLLPAILSLIGNGFDFGRLPWQKRITDIEKPDAATGRGFWHWVTRPAMKFAIASLLLCAGIMIVCISPMMHMRLGYSYVDTLPPTCISRSGYDAMMQAGYPNMLVAPLDIAIDGYDKPEVKAETEALIQRMDQDGGFVTAVPLAVNEAGDVAWKRVFLNMDPFTADASKKVDLLRNELIGDSFTAAGGDALVTGYGAFNNDFVDITESYTTPVMIFVLGLSFLLMLVAFRSILFAVVCTIFNLLSVYAAYGLVVFVFQDGNGMGLYKQIAGIDAYVPIFLLCGLFGISMDYFVFVLSRNRERFDQTGDMNEAIMYSFRRAGLVVLGAAAVMMVVFFAFSISGIVIVAELGFGLTASLLIDATLITLVMSPATMKLLGKWFWWWPTWLSWVPDLRARQAGEEAEPQSTAQPSPGELAPAPVRAHWHLPFRRPPKT